MCKELVAQDGGPEFELQTHVKAGYYKLCACNLNAEDVDMQIPCAHSQLA